MYSGKFQWLHFRLTILIKIFIHGLFCILSQELHVHQMFGLLYQAVKFEHCEKNIQVYLLHYATNVSHVLVSKI